MYHNPPSYFGELMYHNPPSGLRARPGSAPLVRRTVRRRAVLCSRVAPRTGGAVGTGKQYNRLPRIDCIVSLCPAGSRRARTASARISSDEAAPSEGSAARGQRGVLSTYLGIIISKYLSKYLGISRNNYLDISRNISKYLGICLGISRKISRKISRNMSRNMSRNIS
eukprot:SAG31_NODE_9367_length_1289_cov_1.548739_1_plen_167_part_10